MCSSDLLVELYLESGELARAGDLAKRICAQEARQFAIAHHVAAALLDRSEKFFGLETLGADMQGSAMHTTLLAAYDKLFAVAA